MEPLILNEQEKKALQNLGVEALILFGSRAMGNARPHSDYDFGVLLHNPGDNVRPERHREIYNDLYDLLSSKINKIVNIDIVFLENAPAELQMHAAKQGIAIFEPHPAAFARFKERIMLFSADFAPLREIFHRAILKRIP